MSQKIDLNTKIATVMADRASAVKGTLLPIVTRILSKKDAIATLIKSHATPFYLLDADALGESITSFSRAFSAIPHFTPFYAVKSNPYPYILKKVVQRGFGLDVSSGRELQLGLRVGASSIVFSGPGKSDEELQLALDHADRTIVNLDSFRELEKLVFIAHVIDPAAAAGLVLAHDADVHTGVF